MINRNNCSSFLDLQTEWHSSIKNSFTGSILTSSMMQTRDIVVPVWARYSSLPRMYARGTAKPNITFMNTICPRSLDPIYIVTYYIKWVKTPWTYSMYYSLVGTTSPWCWCFHKINVLYSFFFFYQIYFFRSSNIFW